MSGVTRLLSMREKSDRNPMKLHHHHHHARSNLSTNSESISKQNDGPPPTEFYGLFSSSTKVKESEDSKLRILRQRLVDAKIILLKEAQLLWILRCEMVRGDIDAAFDLIVAMINAVEGIITPYDPAVRMLGAVNRQGISCYLDSTLFSMFSRLDTFETMLYNTFDKVPLNKLVFLVRLWVNLLRSGKLITADITKVLQNCIAECGWKEGGQICQQDASEAFTFITGALQLPLLTLKIDIYHTGKEDEKDDHKYVNERLLEVAVPTDPSNDKLEVTLEYCLEEYFNNRIEVKRYLERRSTLQSTGQYDKSKSVHVESVEVDPDSRPSTPLSQSPSHPSPLGLSRTRAESIIQERFIPDQEIGAVTSGRPTTMATRGRSGSMRKEVMMPAWQFYSLIPWYANNAPSNDAQVAHHISTKRPVLGLCLKRYTFTSTGKAIRLNTYVDIPIEIGLPHFIQDDRSEDKSAHINNFKLSLQAVVCHRGRSVNVGHYISLVRGAGPDESDNKSWVKFDDMASPRITTIDIERALKEEFPYLLFYQIVPIQNEKPPTTEKETVNGVVDEKKTGVRGNEGMERANSSTSVTSVIDEQRPQTNGTESSTAASITSGRASTTSLVKITSEDQPPSYSPRTSLEMNNDDTRRRSSVEGRRGSIISFVDGIHPNRRAGPELVLPDSKPRATSPVGKSDTLSRTLSRGSNGINRVMSAVSGRRRSVVDALTPITPPTTEPSLEAFPSPPEPQNVIARTENGVTVAATCIPEEEAELPPHPQHQSAHQQQQHLHVPHPHMHQPHIHRNPSKLEKARQKSSRSIGKNRDAKPDRECSVM